MDAPNRLYFIATFADGTQIFQDAADRSEREKGRNRFFDVLQKKLDTPLVCFVLAAEGMPTFGVDLRDGHFEVNGVPFFQHSDPLQDFRLVYFRNVSQHRTFSPDGSPPVDTADVGYDLGWETEYKGETVKRIMKIK